MSDQLGDEHLLILGGVPVDPHEYPDHLRKAWDIACAQAIATSQPIPIAKPGDLLKKCGHCNVAIAYGPHLQVALREVPGDHQLLLCLICATLAAASAFDQEHQE